MVKEIMTPHFAVFNQHINNAGERTKVAFDKRFGEGAWEKYMQKYEDNGIMTIFQEKPNEYTKWYAEAVAIFVNEN